MRTRTWSGILWAGSIVVPAILFGAASAAAQTLPNAPPANLPTNALHLTLDEAKQRARANSKALALAAMNVQSKGHAVGATSADFFPKVVGSVIYLHFDDPLGTVLTTRGRPRLGVPSRNVSVNVLNQDAPFTTAAVAQPITALLKVYHGVNIAKADQKIAQAQLEAGARAVLVGTEQLYWGLIAAQRVRAGVQVAVQGAELLAKTGTLEARTALVEAKQGLQAAESQVADVQEQLNSLLDLPLDTPLQLTEPPYPVSPVGTAEEAVAAALAASPEVREAEANIAKAKGAVGAAKVDYLPSVNVLGGYAYQDGADYIQNDIWYVGVQGSYTFFEWGKRQHTVREREALVVMAHQKLAQTQDEVRLKAQKAFRELLQNMEALRNATDLAALRKEAVKKATDPTAIAAAAKAQMLAEVDLVKADLAYRVTVAQLMSLIGKD